MSPRHLPKSFLEDAYVFYASYHSDPTNKVIHILCVWPLVLTGILFLNMTPTIADIPSLREVLPSTVKLNLGLIVSIIYVVYYLTIDFAGIAGIIAAAIVVVGYLASTAWIQADPSCWIHCIGVQVVGWAAQLYGHKVFEKRSPALLDNLLQAVLMAPLFVVMEVLFMFGYAPDFQRRTSAGAMENIKVYRASKQK